jgi:hypothetical protein
MPLNDTQAALRWALTTIGVHDHLTDVLVESYDPRQIVEAVAYARSIRAVSVAAVVVKALMKGWRYAPPSDAACRDAIFFLQLDNIPAVSRLYPHSRQA